MTSKEYLSQAYLLDKRIKSKTEQLKCLRDLATRTNMPLSDMPKNPNRGNSKMEDAVLKIVALEDEISEDILNLVTLKQEIMHSIKKVENSEYQMLLELRYLCFKTWEEISVEMGYEIRHIYRLHKRALNEVVTKCH